LDGLKLNWVREESSDPQRRSFWLGSISAQVIAPRGPLKVRFSWGSVGPGRDVGGKVTCIFKISNPSSKNPDYNKKNISFITLQEYL
jgi:hypothetical protein